MKQSILTLLSSLIGSLKKDSVRYHSLILPLIQSSVEPGSVSPIALPSINPHASDPVLGNNCVSSG